MHLSFHWGPCFGVSSEQWNDQTSAVAFGSAVLCSVASGSQSGLKQEQSGWSCPRREKAWRKAWRSPVALCSEWELEKMGYW